jgi:hypothetical protein
MVAVIGGRTYCGAASTEVAECQLQEGDRGHDGDPHHHRANRNRLKRVALLAVCSSSSEATHARSGSQPPAATAPGKPATTDAPMANPEA